MKKDTKAIAILWAVCIIPFFIGLLLMQKSVTKYPTDDYWVAQGYRHVYERGSGRIVDYIEENETCQIKGTVIVVSKKGEFYTFGMILSVIFGMGTAGLIIATIKEGGKNREN